jgi:hypothetical protein
MSALTISPGNYKDHGKFYNKIQKHVDSGNYDEILFEAKGFSNTDYLIGSNTIKITTPMKISGDAGHPRIIGTAGSTLKDSDFKDSGLFSISGGGRVEISDLRMLHIPDPNPHYKSTVNNPRYPNDRSDPTRDDPGMLCHGSSTIACYLDNQKASSLVVQDCEIVTSATGAINVDGINSNPDPLRHDFIVRRCRIPGRHPGQLPADEASLVGAGPNHPLANNFLAGNWLSVKLGPMPTAGETIPAHPVDLRGGHFEVTDCVLDPATFAAIAVWRCQSDTETEFLISNNRIAQSPGAGALSFGVFFGYPGTDLPLGTTLISDNIIKVADRFPVPGAFLSAGIAVEVGNTDPIQKARTVVLDNVVTLSHQAPTEPPAVNLASGILYTDSGPTPTGSMNVTALIEENEISGGTAAPPRWGIALRGAAHDLVVKDNKMSALRAGVAEIFVEMNVHDGIFSGNVLGELRPMTPNATQAEQEAVLYCDGDNNRFFDNDFSLSNAPGWDPMYATGFGYFKLGQDSENNILVSPNLLVSQYYDKAGPATTNHLIQL